MAYQRRGGSGFGKKSFGGKKSEFVRAGFLFQEKKFVPQGAKYKYTGTVTGEYFAPVADVIQKAVAAGTGIRISLVKWNDQEHPILSLAVASESKGGKRIGKSDEGLMDEETDGGGID